MGNRKFKIGVALSHMLHASIAILICMQYSITEILIIEVATPHGSIFNPLTTDDEYTRHETLATCYQLAHSVLKIGFALAKKVG